MRDKKRAASAARFFTPLAVNVQDCEWVWRVVPRLCHPMANQMSRLNEYGKYRIFAVTMPL
jgi:hypothetical protein